ncbi:hypothetical protein B0H16DRAFT_1530005 [Mycena metata]|uniref:Uncharacterized protein n=1 Tax=Mycena metata TaxID=1033252 RepID=A0AAD7JFB8_9AGAR|nr:hypothetical protein B0H16DRAFT_1530005 [Mycena metata]
MVIAYPWAPLLLGQLSAATALSRGHDSVLICAEGKLDACGAVVLPVSLLPWVFTVFQDLAFSPHGSGVKFALDLRILLRFYGINKNSLVDF